MAREIARGPRRWDLGRQSEVTQDPPNHDGLIDDREAQAEPAATTATQTGLLAGTRR